jgi:hypothetical protein
MGFIARVRGHSPCVAPRPAPLPARQGLSRNHDGRRRRLSRRIPRLHRRPRTTRSRHPHMRTEGTTIAGMGPGGVGRAGTSAITVPGSGVTGGAVLWAGTGGGGAAVPIMAGAIGVDATRDVFTAAVAAIVTADS